MGRLVCTTRVLQVVWAVALLWCELMAFQLAVFRCTWPAVDQGANVLAVMPGVPDEVRPGDSAVADRGEPARILVLTDPQITDAYSYGQSGLSLLLTQYFSDSYMRKTVAMLARLDPPPQAMLMLGDMFDGGRVLDDVADFDSHAERYEAIFSRLPEMPTFNATGNHDVGLGQYCNPQAAAWYRRHFGPTDYFTFLGNFSVVVVNSPAMYSGPVCPAEQAKVLNFVESMQTELEAKKASAPTAHERQLAVERAAEVFTDLTEVDAGAAPSPAHFPRVLITHIPLDRQDKRDCGGERGARSMVEGYGVSYRNFHSKPRTEELLASTRPLLALSGDDHDVCRYAHDNSGWLESKGNDASRTYAAATQEFTAGTLSWLQGERHPSFALMTLLNDGKGPAAAAIVPCRLPDQLGMYLTYVGLVVVSLIALVAAQLAGVKDIRRQCRSCCSCCSCERNRTPILDRRTRGGVWQVWWMNMRSGGWRGTVRLVCGAVAGAGQPASQILASSLALWVALRLLEYWL